MSTATYVQHPLRCTAADARDRSPVERHETPDYAMRRLGAVVVVLCSLLIATVAVTATVDAVRGLGGRPAAASETASAAPATYVAAPGDTLWSIAERFRGDVDLVRYVDALIAQNGGTAIDVGQAVRLP
jgi:hypothetical protein